MNDKLRTALETGKYPCMECGSLMIFEDEKWKDSLVCENCGYSCKLDDYGLDSTEVDRKRITEVAGEIESKTETYEEIYGDND